MDRLVSFVSGKRIALVGNAQSLVEQGAHEIDEHDIVIRINRGIDVVAESSRIGKRTDVLLVSSFVKEIDELLQRVPLVVYMSPMKRELLGEPYTSRLAFYPENWWRSLTEEIGARPSTGCMGVDMLSRVMGSGELHLFGFDFWRSPTSYNGINRPGPHSPSAEEAYMRRRLPPERIHGAEDCVLFRPLSKNS